MKFTNPFKKSSKVVESTKKNYIDDGFIPFNMDGLGLLSTEAYYRLYKGWVFTAVSTIADSISNLDYVLINKSGNEKYHEYLDLITPEILQNIASYLKLNGNAFIYKEMIGNRVDNLQVLRSDLVQAELNDEGEIYKYYYSGMYKRYEFNPEDLIIIKNFNPLDGFKNEEIGLSDMNAVAMQADSEQEAINWNWTFFKNNASAGDILENDETMEDTEIKRMSNLWNRTFRGTKNAHKIAILSGGLKYKNGNKSQKEMDFVEQRRFTRDEILAIFKVPKAVIGMGESVNTGNVTAFERIYALRTIQPLANRIANALNKQLFNGIGIFKFVNVVPADQEQARSNYLAGGLKLNEFRQDIGRQAIENGEVFINGETENLENEQKAVNPKYTKIIKSCIKGTDEYEQKRWEKKIMRNNKYEDIYKKQLLKIFNIQKDDVLKGLSEKAFKLPKWNDLKYITLYHSLLKTPQNDLVQSEGDIAMEEVKIDGVFRTGATQTTKYLFDNIDKFAKEIDKTTRTSILQVIDEGNKQGLGANEITKNLNNVFDILTTSRLESIARTETIRAGSYATQLAWEQSEVVSGKQWWTSLDERVCPNCNPMHGKKIGLKEDFFKKGDTAPGGLKLDYSNTPASPLHPQCRCSLIPIIKD